MRYIYIYIHAYENCINTYIRKQTRAQARATLYVYWCINTEVYIRCICGMLLILLIIITMLLPMVINMLIQKIAKFSTDMECAWGLRSYLVLLFSAALCYSRHIVGWLNLHKQSCLHVYLARFLIVNLIFTFYSRKLIIFVSPIFFCFHLLFFHYKQIKLSVCFRLIQ